MSKQFKNFMSKALWLLVILFGIRCFISWGEITANPSVYSIVSFAGEAIGVTVFIMLLYEKWLWRTRVFQKMEDTPCLYSEYSGVIKSEYDGIEREVNLKIKQSLLSVHITMTSGESGSKSISSSIDTILGEKQLTYCYLNTPKTEYRHKSEIHYGTAMLNVENVELLTGQYFTDRNTRGDMMLHAKKPS